MHNVCTLRETTQGSLTRDTAESLGEFPHGLHVLEKCSVIRTTVTAQFARRTHNFQTGISSIERVAGCCRFEIVRRLLVNAYSTRLREPRRKSNGDTARRVVVRRLRTSAANDYHERSLREDRWTTSSWRTGRRAVRAVAAISDELGRARCRSAASVGYSGESSVYVTSHN